MKTKIKALVIEVLAELILGESVDCDDCLIKEIMEVLMEKFTRLKMSKDELQDYLIFKRRGSMVEAKKGKGAKYKRSRDLKAFA